MLSFANKLTNKEKELNIQYIEYLSDWLPNDLIFLVVKNLT